MKNIKSHPSKYKNWGTAALDHIYVISHMDRRLISGSNCSEDGTSHHLLHTDIPLRCLPCPAHKYKNTLRQPHSDVVPNTSLHCDKQHYYL